MATPRLLDQSILDALDAWAIERGASALLDERIHRLDATDVERRSGSIGIRMSDEAQAWYERYGGGVDRHVDLLPGLARLSLARALEKYGRLRADGAEQARAAGDLERLCDPELWWNAAWLPIFVTGSRDTYAVDCGVPDGAPSPVLQIDWERIPQCEYDTPIAPSLGSFLCQRINQYSEAGWHYEASAERWVIQRPSPR